MSMSISFAILSFILLASRHIVYVHIRIQCYLCTICTRISTSALETLRTFITYTLTQTVHISKYLATSSCHVNGEYGFVELNKNTRTIYRVTQDTHVLVHIMRVRRKDFGNMPGI